MWKHKSFFIGGIFGFLSGLFASQFLYSVILLVVVGMFFIPAYAWPESIAIQISNSCMTMHRHNVTSDCPTYEEILTVFPDTSDHIMSGGFAYSDDGVYERQKTKIKNHYEFYRYNDETMIWVDPPNDVRSRMKVITLESRLPEYTIKEQTLDSHQLNIGIGRWNNIECTRVTMTSDNWLFLLGDTLQFLKNSCDPKFTNFNNIKTIYFKDQDFDRTNSLQYKLNQWILDAKERCKGLCFEY